MEETVVIWRLGILLVCLEAIAAAGEHPCAACHEREVQTFSRSAMSRSLSTAASQPTGTLNHKRSGSTVTISHKDGQMIQRVDARGLHVEYPVAYAVGDGKIGYSYLVAVGSYLFQSPVSYYSQEGKWDVTPGYEPERVLDFTHPISEGCVFCHAGRINLASGTENRFGMPALTAISCERCHGSVERHLRRPVKGSIVNPSKLAGRARDSICEQCHLEGEVRILNPGKRWLDFQPGADLESVLTAYVRRGDPQGRVKAVSHSEQLALSRCARNSNGRLWCGTCHNPHSDAVDRSTEMRGICLSCHSALFAVQKHKPVEECVSCHMPRLRPSNVAHAAITDHRIGIPSSKGPQAESSPALVAWREPPAAYVSRNLGLALFQSAADSQDTEALAKSYELLSHLAVRDPEVCATLASLLLRQNDRTPAITLAAEAARLQPSNARYAYLLGAALFAGGRTPEAISELRRSIGLDPSSPDPYLKLGAIYAQTGLPEMEKRILREYLEFMPQNLQIRRMLAGSSER